jgi:Tfp pilus assembly protein PilF
VKRGQETLQAVIQDDPQSVDAHFLLGKLYKESGQKLRATNMFKKVLELRPDHEEALAEVGPLLLDDDGGGAGPAPAGGLLGKLFRKG